MLFSEPLFLFAFLPTFLLLYALATWNHRSRIGLLLLASILFYGWGEPGFMPVAAASAALDHLLALRMARRRSSILLAVGISANLAILFFYKYVVFTVITFRPVLRMLSLPELPVPHILLPIGVSFVVFEKITYLVDVHRGVSPPAPSFRRYLTYVFFFPKLLAGPIIKYHDIDAQFRRPPALRGDMVFSGFQRFMVGLVKKLLIADMVAGPVEAIFSTDPHALGCGTAWLGVVLFTLQIYFDFSAYSDMAIGIARMLGFSLLENFDRPYISGSITEFWRRWHISLSTWIRDYLYIPLGGSRVRPARQYFNLWICFLASGLWHGAAWTFIAWGAYNGCFLVLERLFLKRWLDRLPRLVANILTMLVVMVGWTIFRSSSLGGAAGMLHAMIALRSDTVTVYITPAIWVAGGVGVLICCLSRLLDTPTISLMLLRPIMRAPVLQGALLVLFLLALTKAVAEPFQPFLYFRF